MVPAAVATGFRVQFIVPPEGYFVIIFLHSTGQLFAGWRIPPISV